MSKKSLSNAFETISISFSWSSSVTPFLAIIPISFFTRVFIPHTKLQIMQISTKTYFPPKKQDIFVLFQNLWEKYVNYFQIQVEIKKFSQGYLKSKSQWWELFSHPSGIKKLFLVYLTFQILWEKFSNYFTHTHLCVSSRDVFGAGEFFSLSHTHTFQSRRNLHDFSCQNFFTKFEKGARSQHRIPWIPWTSRD